MRRSFLITFISLIFPLLILDAQPLELKETFLEAESYFVFEEYNEAINAYLRIHRAAPENNNINYKIGICFLHDPYQKEKSIEYLERASKDVNPDCKENNFKETTAPPEAFYYLGNAYLVNNMIDKALENYTYFLTILDKKIYDVDLVEEKIRICYQAKELMSKPVDYDYVNLGDLINSRFTDKNPIISGDGNSMMYVSERQFYTATFFSEKVDGVWQAPRMILPELQIDVDDIGYPTCLSWDGTTMIFYKNDDYIGNLYISNLKDGIWTPLEKLGSNINTRYWESHGTLTKDGKSLYFTSNRKGGYGGLDIYISHKLDDGTWGKPENLGKKINSQYNEDTPFLTEDEEKLYFSSFGHYNMGGYDIFYSVRDKKENWSEPVNIGYPINTTDDDLFFMPVNNGENAYFGQIHEEGFGRHDIYYLTIYSPDNPRKYLVKGAVRSDSGMIHAADSVMLYLIDSNTNDTLQKDMLDETSKVFQFKALMGEYDLQIRSRKYDDLNKHIQIDKQTDISGMVFSQPFVLKTKILKPDTIYIPAYFNPIFFDVDSYKLSNKAINKLNELTSILTDFPLLKLEIIGHTDTIGNYTYNENLAIKRASIASEYLLSKGIDLSRLQIYSKGESDPISKINESDPQDQKAINRRVDFKAIIPKDMLWDMINKNIDIDYEE